MSNITNNKYTEEVHPWNWHIPHGATGLFIGTFPTEKRNRKHDFFYSSSTNRFWEIMYKVAQPLHEIEDETEEVKKRKRILQKLKLGLTDMGKKILRQQGSSNDHSLFPLEFNDISLILTQHPTIKKIIVTGNSQGNSSLSWFGIFCSINNISFNAKQLEKQKSGIVTLNNKPIEIKSTYSPSRLSRVQTDIIIQNYKSILL